MAVVPTWIEKLNIQPGDHIIAIVTDEEDYSLLPRYASEGIAKGDLCNVFGASHELPALRRYMRDHGVAVEESERSGQLTFGDPCEMGRNEAGEFNPQLLLQNLEQFASSLTDRGVRHLRSIGSTSWLTGMVGAKDGIYLCARFNEIFKDTPISGL